MSGDGMSAFVTAATAVVNSTSLWSEVTDALPLISGILIFTIGFTIVRRVLKGASRGKFKI